MKALIVLLPITCFLAAAFVLNNALSRVEKRIVSIRVKVIIRMLIPVVVIVLAYMCILLQYLFPQDVSDYQSLYAGTTYLIVAIGIGLLIITTIDDIRHKQKAIKIVGYFFLCLAALLVLLFQALRLLIPFAT